MGNVIITVLSQSKQDIDMQGKLCTASSIVDALTSLYQAAFEMGERFKEGWKAKDQGVGRITFDTIIKVLRDTFGRKSKRGKCLDLQRTIVFGQT